MERPVHLDLDLLKYLHDTFPYFEISYSLKIFIWLEVIIIYLSIIHNNFCVHTFELSITLEESGGPLGYVAGWTAYYGCISKNGWRHFILLRLVLESPPYLSRIATNFGVTVDYKDHLQVLHLQLLLWPFLKTKNQINLSFLPCQQAWNLRL